MDTNNKSYLSENQLSQLRKLQEEVFEEILTSNYHLDGSLLALCSTQSNDHERISKHLEVLLSAGVDVNEKDKNGVTPLHRAVRFRNLTAVQLLIKKGAKVDILDSRSKSTPLHRSVVHSGAPFTKGKVFEQKEIIKLLLKAGANPNLKNKKGKRPVDYIRNIDILQLFE